MPRVLPDIFLEKETISKRVQLYRDQKHRDLSQQLSEKAGKSVQDTKSVWYSKEQVKTWLDEMEYYGGDGLRIYIGQIEELAPGEQQDALEPIPGQLCLMMILTKRGSFDNSHVNIIYEQMPDFGERKQFTEEQRGTGNSRQFNYGGYCPPFCLTEGEDFPI